MFFVRHGEAAHNIFEHGFYTRDNQLSAHGRRQAVACGNVLRSIALKDGPFDRAIVSPMRRTIETCLLSLEAMDGSKSFQMPQIILEVEVVERHAGYLCDCGSPCAVLQQQFPALDFSRVKRRERLEHSAAAAVAAKLGYQNPALFGSAEPNTHKEMMWWDSEEERLAVELAAASKNRKKGIGKGKEYHAILKQKMHTKLRERINGRFKASLEEMLSGMVHGSRVLVYAHGGVYSHLLSEMFGNCEIQQYDYECNEDGSNGNTTEWLKSPSMKWAEPSLIPKLDGADEDLLESIRHLLPVGSEHLPIVKHKPFVPQEESRGASSKL